MISETILTSGQSTWYKAASPPQTDHSIVSAGWRQCAILWCT